jgi:hypothetical protein
MEMRYRYYFIEALALTIILFIGGFMLGMLMENNRNAELASLYSSVEIEILDLGDKLDISNLGKYTCSELVSRNSEIGDEIYSQALIFQRYEDAAIFTKDKLVEEHRKFDILRTMFWINSVKIKDRCGSKVFDTVVYLYDYPVEDMGSVAKQRIMESITAEIKDGINENIVLIPIAKNLNISTLDSMIEKYANINESAVLIINEHAVFLSNQTAEIRAYFNITK